MSDQEDTFLHPIKYNIVLNMQIVFSYLFCNSVGLWGMFWYNDAGEMMNACLETGLGGARAEFYEYDDGSVF